MNYFWMNCYSIKGLIKAHWSHRYCFYWFQWAMNFSLFSQEYSSAEPFLRRERPARKGMNTYVILTKKSRSVVIRVPDLDYLCNCYYHTWFFHYSFCFEFPTFYSPSAEAWIQPLTTMYLLAIRQVGKCTFSFSL